MVKLYYYFQNNLFLNILLIINYSTTIYTLSFKYSNAITLNNGNIFVIHETGITICNPSFSKIIKNVTVFTSGNRISSANYLSKVSISQFNEGYIVSVIINKIYIFNPEGNSIYTSDVITSNNVKIFISRDELYIPSNGEKQYYYLLGYIYQDSIYLKYYYYVPSSNSNNLHSFTNEKKDYYYNYYSDVNFLIKNEGISCQMLYYFIFFCLVFIIYIIIFIIHVYFLNIC